MDVGAERMTHSATAAPDADLQARFDAQRRAFAADRFPEAAARGDRLERMRRLVEENEQRFASAICADFGNRSRHETVIAETFFVLALFSAANRPNSSTRVFSSLSVSPNFAKRTFTSSRNRCTSALV